MGGCIPPPTSLKVTILAEKSASILNNSAPFRNAYPPTDLNVTNPAAKSVSILVKTFFFFFGDHLSLGDIFPFSAEKPLSTLVKTSEFLRFWLQIPPTKIFWIRHCPWVLSSKGRLQMDFSVFKPYSHSTEKDENMI